MTALIFVERSESGLFSLYRRPDGTKVHVPQERFLVEWDLDEAIELWGTGLYTRNGFRDFLLRVLTDPSIAHDIAWCERCDELGDLSDLVSTQDGGLACQGCIDDAYYCCASCDEYHEDTYYTLHDNNVCNSCRERYYAYCDTCEGYYNTEYEEDHEHGDPGCCEAPAQNFTVRNDGLEPLANDTRVTVSLPAGTIDEEGLQRIFRYLRNNTVAVQARYDENDALECWYLHGRHSDAQLGKAEFSDHQEALEAAYAHNTRMSRAAELVLSSAGEDFIGNKVQTRDGNYTKRLSRAAHKLCEAKIEPLVLSQVGNIASEHSQAVDFAIEVTRDLNLSPEDFANDDSCWWGSEYRSRCALKTNGGFGLRSFEPDGWVSGRAWVMPLKFTDPLSPHLAPTFDTQTPNAFMVFNGYGALEGYNAARIVAHMAGWTYRKIGFACNPMYVNNGTGYLVAPEEVAAHYTDGELHLDVEQHSSLHQRERMQASLSSLEHAVQKELVHVA